MGVNQRLLGFATSLVLGAVVAPSAKAAIWTEGTSPAVFLGGAGPEAVGSGIDEIRGAISGGDQGDLFKITFAVGGTLDILARGAASDTMNLSLFLFDASGGGIRVDDNSGPLFSARLIVTISAGTYFLGIGDDPLRAVDTDGTTWDASGVADGAPPPDFGVLDRLQNTGTVVSPGNYRITLSMLTGDPPVSSVPEPMTLGLLGAGLLGLAHTRFRRRR